MIVSKLIVSAFLSFVICTCFAQNPGDHPPLSRHGLVTDQHLRMMSNMMLKYVISKGCDYVHAFVKGHYYKYGHVDDDHTHNRDGTVKTCDWKPWVEKKCGQYHIPIELCCALMDCGAPSSMDALGAPYDMVEKCNMTDDMHRIHGFGKRSSNGRYGDPQSTSHMCQGFQAAIMIGKREGPLDSAVVHQIKNVTLLSQHGHLAWTTSFKNSSAREDVLNSARSRLIRRWCKVFSRNINKKYHLNEIKFTRRSMYWLVDIYKASLQHHVPNYYTHGLVGCGIDYAMVAFNVQKWQTTLYKLALK
ncbi:uncharacterized protein LOC123523660 [Mercenaria mercenaria]|uniref:uncharacterized protein LOC123523660 n=1 Tax=Mercenaria mercenaria TaxID=6596 RepID=UPI00234F74CC|nr:uncharacterized protein LOC123523660 [Mercenaria mercenaria]